MPASEAAPQHTVYRDAGTITDVCNSTDLPEVEIISLLEEQLPHYRLRADTVYGYDHDDWLHTPLVSTDVSVDLSTEQIEETLKYFLLCAERVGQMTKTYSDIDAVTRLLEEREQDLELAARIGQSLLKRNRSLVEHNEYLQEQVGRVQEEVFQLHHELAMKDELLRFYTSAAEDSDGDSSSSSPLRRNRSTCSEPSCFPVDSLQKKLQDLEKENILLRCEASHLKNETTSYEEKEHKLVNDCVRELRESNLQITSIAEELAKKSEDASRQQEEITQLLSQIVELQKKARSFAVENEELTQHLMAAKEAQHQLTAELQELGDKYAECIEMLHEAQEELKNLRNKSLPSGTSRRFHPMGLFPMDSLAAEIEGSMRKEMLMDDSETEEHKDGRVVETVKNMEEPTRQHTVVLPAAGRNIPGSNWASLPAKAPLPGSTTTAHSAQVEGSNKTPRTPSSPDSHNLEVALRRLSLRRENYLSERRFSKEDRDSPVSNKGCPRAPDTIMSLGTHLSGLSFSSRSYLPDKLQIVKPLEGSLTLHHWQQLAQPNLGGILDSRPGVVPKGFRPLELEDVYRFSEFEEDEPQDLFFQSFPCSSTAQHQSGSHVSCSSTFSSLSSHIHMPEAPVFYPGKCMSHTSSTYTFTTCRILHPSDELTRVTPSLNAAGSTASCVVMSSLKLTPTTTPCTPRRLSLAESFTNLRDSTKTTSTSLGLVHLLREHGISAAVYNPPTRGKVNHGAPLSASWIQDLPLLTLPSSPPGRAPAASAEADTAFNFQSCGLPYDNFLASRPARFILNEVAAEARNHSDRGSQTDVSIYNLNLVDKLKRFSVARPETTLGALTRPGPPFTLSTELQRNRSYPALVGASMAMKGPGPPSSEVLLDSKLPKQRSLR
ncbi:trafficking kinesin-binding protein 1-like isoform X2 [Scleropages formosus]|uniref:trafficking kinesin-binding protein 1-like isoform X2 n=1 Tax=Scleropages formosus TaxID=113540 RepID=UPI0008785527|nr:trafficking kinesin-binding protein 1-like isoform X2 [Scleropages formosus]